MRVSLLLFFVLTGCAVYPPLQPERASEQDTAQQGPRVIAANFQQTDSVSIVRAQVQPSGARVKEVRLVFQEAPIELKMMQVSDQVWEAVVPPSRLKQLSIPGQTPIYHVRVIALDEGGLLSMVNPVLQLVVQSQG